MAKAALIDQYWQLYQGSQEMSFIRFLVYGWFLGIIGVLIFYPLYLFAVPYFCFYTLSFRKGRKTAGAWRSVNVRRCFGATIDEKFRNHLRSQYLGKERVD